MNISKAEDTKRSNLRLFSVEALICFIALIGIVACILSFVFIHSRMLGFSLSIVVVAICIAVIAAISLNPESIRARQTSNMLRLSGQMVDIMASGMTPDVAQAICALLLPNTAAIAVAITDTTTILGYVGYRAAYNPQGANIRTQATHDAIKDGQVRVIRNVDEIGLPVNDRRKNSINGAIIVPLRIGKQIHGTLKFYYKSPRKITETQKSIATGFGNLLSIQLAAIELEKQRELATKMELKMLQNQINPHFLFNTINTIASLIRTDPSKAYLLLRDFAVFYRATLENSQDLISLARELQQTIRYFSFETARFGEERLGMEVRVCGFGSEEGDLPSAAMSNSAIDAKVSENKSDTAELDVSKMKVPPFLLQPLVENAVKHAMPATGKLTVNITSEVAGKDVLIHVEDDGVGMTEEARQNIMHPDSSTGLGIAVKNVHDRMHGYFGENAEMIVESELGKGTVVTLRFPGMVDTLRSE